MSTDPQIFPGFQAVGQIPEALRAGLVVYSASALNTLQSAPENIVKWADIAGVTAGEWTAKIPIDITALNGFQEDKGQDLDYKQMDLLAIDVAGVPFYNAAEWSSALAQANMPLTNVQNMGGNMIAQARRHKARMAGTVIKSGTPSVNLAKTYPQPGAPNGLSLFNVAQYVNPGIPQFGTFKNYYAAFGKFSNTTFAATRTNMRMVPSPTGDQETLGLEVTKIIGPSHMEEPFRQVALQNLSLQVATVGGDGVAGAVSNIYTSGAAAWTYEIAPALDNDPYLLAYKVAHPDWTPDTLPHMWIAVSQSIPGANLIEMIAPSAAFVPRVSVLGVGSEHEIKRDKVAIIARMRCGAAAGLPHVGARYEET